MMGRRRDAFGASGGGGAFLQAYPDDAGVLASVVSVAVGSYRLLFG